MPTPQEQFPRPRLLDQVRDEIRLRHYSLRTEHTYLGWIKRFILFHNKRHPSEMGAAEITRYLTHLAVQGKVLASTQNQALNAILFLYREILKVDLPWLDGIQRAKKPTRLPVVLSRDEVRSLLAQLDGTRWLIVSLIYGGGLRLTEALRLVIRDAKGQKDRVTTLPESLIEPLRQHLTRVKERHRQDLREGFERVGLPYALAKKYPQADRGWAWQYVFPSAGRSKDPRSDAVRRHHVHESAIQKAVKNAVRAARIVKPASVHTLRHSLDSPHPCGSPFGRAKARQILFQTKFCYAFAGGWLRHSDGSGVARPFGREHDHDLHPCAAKRRTRSAQPTGRDDRQRSATRTAVTRKRGLRTLF